MLKFEALLRPPLGRPHPDRRVAELRCSALLCAAADQPDAGGAAEPVPQPSEAGGADRRPGAPLRAGHGRGFLLPFFL